MAKIIHKGMWIDIKSLNAEDKKNFLTSLAFGFIASILWGMHLSHIGFLGNEPTTDTWISETGLLVIRILMIVFFLIGAFFYKKFYSAQDDFYKSYHNFTLAGVFIDIIFDLNLINFVIDFLVALITLISLFLYGLNWFKLTAKLHRE